MDINVEAVLRAKVSPDFLAAAIHITLSTCNDLELDPRRMDQKMLEEWREAAVTAICDNSPIKATSERAMREEAAIIMASAIKAFSLLTVFAKDKDFKQWVKIITESSSQYAYMIDEFAVEKLAAAPLERVEKDGEGSIGINRDKFLRSLKVAGMH